MVAKPEPIEKQLKDTHTNNVMAGCYGPGGQRTPQTNASNITDAEKAGWWSTGTATFEKINPDSVF